MELSIKELKNAYLGHDIYVIGAGPSAGYIDPAFFNNKITLGVNETYRRFPNCDFMVRKETKFRAEAAYAANIPLIVPRHNCGTLGYKKTKFEGHGLYYVFEHDDNSLDGPINLDVIATTSDKIVVSYSTITSALHVAAYMGAANILVIGHDCGKLDGEIKYPGYPPSAFTPQFYEQWVGMIEPQTLEVRARLMEVYGCQIYSINPFINFGLEGHRYERI